MRKDSKLNKAAGIIIGIILILFSSCFIIQGLKEGGDSFYSLIITIPFFVLGVVLLVTRLRKSSPHDVINQDSTNALNISESNITGITEDEIIDPSNAFDILKEDTMPSHDVFLYDYKDNSDMINAAAKIVVISYR